MSKQNERKKQKANCSKLLAALCCTCFTFGSLLFVAELLERGLATRARLVLCNVMEVVLFIVVLCVSYRCVAFVGEL